MATNPFEPVFPIRLAERDGHPMAGATSVNPFIAGRLSQQSWDMMNPQQQADWVANLLTGGDDSDSGGSGGSSKSKGNFNDDSQLDQSQVAHGGSGTAPLVSSVGQVPQSQTRDQSTWPNNIPPINPSNSGTVHEFTPEGRLTAQQIKQRDKSLAGNARMDARQSQIAALQAPVVAMRSGLTKEHIAPHFLSSDSHLGAASSLAEVHAVSLDKYVKKLRTAWNANEAEYEARQRDMMSPPGTRAPTRAAAVRGAEPQVVTAPNADFDRGTTAAMAAMGMIGQPVKFGQETAHGADEVGLSRIAWGSSMPNLQEAQLRTGPHLALKQAQPGDLVGRVDSQGNQHVVGVYLKNNEFVAPAGGQFARRHADEYGDHLFAVRPGGTGPSTDRGRASTGSSTTGRRTTTRPTMSPAARSNAARNVGTAAKKAATSLSHVFDGGGGAKRSTPSRSTPSRSTQTKRAPAKRTATKRAPAKRTATKRRAGSARKK